MKHYTFLSFLTVLMCILLFAGCNAGASSGSGSSGKANFDKEASYTLGYSSGMDWKNVGVFPDINEVVKGIKDAYKDEEAKFTSEEAYDIINTAYMAIQEKKNEESLQAGIDFLAENSKKEGIFVTESGLQYEIVTEGRGVQPGPEDAVRVHYEGTLIDGTVFDSSYTQGEPVEFPLSAVVPGWSEGLQLMSEGAVYNLFIPSELGYGIWGAGPMVPPNSVLVFKVELITVIK